MNGTSTFSVEYQYWFYHNYHNNKVNKFIHLVGVPIIHCTAIVLLWRISFIIPGTEIRSHIAAPATLFLLAYYCALDKQFALLMTPYVLAVTALSWRLARDDIVASLFPVVVLHCLAWGLQIVGHMYFEKNMPALTESPVQAILIAPMFVVLEVVFAFGLGHSLRTRLRRARYIQKAKKTLASS